ncbi:MAG: carboxylating nicotinate-nucleotide diphosphorylase [Chromatiales bacterium]|nr:carboxylating nicotinate-nucleotide diphosphorylase [Chromatiales bacterium]
MTSLAKNGLDPSLLAHIASSVAMALAEDIGGGDLTAQLVPVGQRAAAEVTCREAAVSCGRPWFDHVFQVLDPGIRVTWMVEEGEAISPGQVLCRLDGPARALLTGERTALNFLQSLSGVATVTRTYVEALAGTSTKILDTRKTVPGLRLAQKYAVRIGGALNHRIGLFDAILVKENHIIAAGGVSAAIRRGRAVNAEVLLEVEVESLEEAREALTAGADRLLLDDMTLPEMREAVALRDRLAPEVAIEASGGMDLRTVRNVAETGVDFISVGALTKHLRAIDLSMRFSIGS